MSKALLALDKKHGGANRTISQADNKLNLLDILPRCEKGKWYTQKVKATNRK